MNTITITEPITSLPALSPETGIGSILERAADLIDHYGLFQGSGLRGVGKDGSICGIIAISWASKDLHLAKLSSKSLDYVKEGTDDGRSFHNIVRWVKENDQQTVTRTLRELAAKA